jgi:uncharacterized protein YecT (DUF1311 family)
MRILIFAACAVGMSVGAASAADPPLYKMRDCSSEVVQMAINQCTGDNLGAADAELNRVYRKLIGEQTDQKSKDKLRNLERAWVAYRDKECDSEVGPQSEGGSSWPMDMNTCLQQKTDAQIRKLKTIGN